MNESILKNCFDEARHAVVVFESEGHLVYKNASFDMCFPQVSKDKVIFDLLVQNPLLLERVQKMVQLKGSYSLWDFPVERADHSIKTMDIECYPVVSSLQTKAYFCLILYDRSGSVQADEHQKRLDRIQYLATITSGLAHEIRNPLSGIKGAAQLLMDSLKGQEDLQEYADIIQKEIVRVDQLLKDLQHLTQPKKLTKKPVNLNRVVRDIYLLQKTVESKRIEYQEEYDPSLPEINADAAALAQVVLNLVKNARQAIKDKGKISIKTRIVTDFVMQKGNVKQQYVSIDVLDTGSGIEPEAAKNIFIPFFTTKTAGTGLGLALCQQIVEEHGGQLLVKSEEGRGSLFSVLLPV